MVRDGAECVEGVCGFCFNGHLQVSLNINREVARIGPKQWTIV